MKHPEPEQPQPRGESVQRSWGRPCSLREEQKRPASMAEADEGGV